MLSVPCPKSSAGSGREPGGDDLGAFLLSGFQEGNRLTGGDVALLSLF